LRIWQGNQHIMATMTQKMLNPQGVKKAPGAVRCFLAWSAVELSARIAAFHSLICHAVI